MKSSKSRRTAWGKLSYGHIHIRTTQVGTTDCGRFRLRPARPADDASRDQPRLPFLGVPYEMHPHSPPFAHLHLCAITNPIWSGKVLPLTSGQLVSWSAALPRRRRRSCAAVESGGSGAVDVDIGVQSCARDRSEKKKKQWLLRSFSTSRSRMVRTVSYLLRG